ncbi:MAG: hypothetical protein Q9M11_05255 [Mariprofundaceae bacterium]|nr:hypothetical protein [Mariprofundaceae bacterium]
MFDITSNTFINILFIIGLGQMTWLSSMLLRRGLERDMLWQATAPLLSIWVLIWPVYSISWSIWLPIYILGIVLLLIYSIAKPFCLTMRVIWGKPYPLPMLSLTISLSIAMAFFQYMPEFGLALGLTLCLAFPLADLLDRIPNQTLGFPFHPQQTLLGHLGLLIASTFLCSWSIHLYHPMNWQLLMMATLIAAIAASLLRALCPKFWNLPLSTLAMGWILWLL